MTPVVYVVDDDVSMREALELLMQSAGWRTQIFSSARQFLSHERISIPHCLILDATLPDLSGLELQQLVADRVEMPIIFISAHGDIPMTVRAMKAGAVEFLTKPLDENLLLTAISHAIARSELQLRHAAEMRVLRERYQMLSNREREVMALVVAGLLNKQVGGDLGITEITVKVHRANVMRKMHAASLPDLVNMAARLRS